MSSKRGNHDLGAFIAMLRAWTGDETAFYDVFRDAVIRAAKEAEARNDLGASMLRGIEARTNVPLTLLRRYLAAGAPADPTMRVIVLRAAADWLETTYLSERPS